MGTIATTKTLFAVYFAIGTTVANVEHTIAFPAAATDGTNSLDGFGPFHRVLDPNRTLFGRTLQQAADTDEDDDVGCLAEFNACEEDAACMACVDSATMDGTCDPEDVNDCAGVADHLCCVVGADCSDNEYLADYLSCQVGICTFADFCDHSTTLDSDDTDGGGSGGDDIEEVDDFEDDDEELCPTEMNACIEDPACLACFNGVTVDETCDTGDMTDCADVSDYLCCVVGDACGDNEYLVDYINCAAEIESCTLTDFCDHTTSTDSGDDVDGGGGGDDDAMEMVTSCADEIATCAQDADCLSCMTAPSVNDGSESCEAMITADTACSGVENMLCCLYGGTETCRDNAPFLDFASCAAHTVLPGDQCTLTELCSSTSRTISESWGSDSDDDYEPCPVELVACKDDDSCKSCLDVASMDESCDITHTDCSGLTDLFCCVIGGTDSCRTNHLLVEYVNCGIGPSCSLTDLCDYTPEVADDDVSGEIDDDASDDDDDDVDIAEQCNAEIQACVTDPDCLSCVQNEAVCDSSATATCSGVMDYLCCVYGNSCSDNALVVAYIDCALDDYGCSVDSDLCDTEDDNGTLLTPEINDDDVEDVEPCPAELTACLSDETCGACYGGATLDGSCDGPATDCVDLANYYCCVAGDDCSDNPLAIGYINCLIENQLDDEPCVLTDACAYTGDDDAAERSGDDDEGMFGEGPEAASDDDRDDIDRGVGELFSWSPTSSPTSSPTGSHGGGGRGGGRGGGGRGRGGDDGGGAMCLTQEAICIADSACAACMAGATRDGSCDATVPDCAGVADYYCCLAGDVRDCSDNALLLDLINCEIELDSCTLTELCSDVHGSGVEDADDDDVSSRRGGDKGDGGNNGNDNHEYSTEAPWFKPGGPGTGEDDDAQDIDRGFFSWSPTSSPTSSPTWSHEEQHRGRGRIGGGGRDDGSGRAP
ncbi:unnamed protein product [Ectocarpus fasciculatus]